MLDNVGKIGYDGFDQVFNIFCMFEVSWMIHCKIEH